MCATSSTVLCWSFLNFTGVFVMDWRYACALDIILRLIFDTFFRILNFVIFQFWILSKGIDSGYLVCATPPIVLCQSFWNCTGVFVMVWRCACGLDIILRLIVVTFFYILNQVIFLVQILSKGFNSGYFLCTAPPVLCRSFWNFTGVFIMVWRCACGLNIILRLFFITFFAFWT